MLFMMIGETLGAKGLDAPWVNADTFDIIISMEWTLTTSHTKISHPKYISFYIIRDISSLNHRTIILISSLVLLNWLLNQSFFHVVIFALLLPVEFVEFLLKFS